MKKIVILFLVQSFLSGCGVIILHNALKNKSERTYDNRPQAEKSFSQSTVECNEGDCPSFVGGLYTISLDRRTVGACSMTLIGPDRVLTNAHCLPDDIAFKGANCRGRILINFPKTSAHSQERIDCQRVENMSKEMSRVRKPDWAILQLKRATLRAAAILDGQGIPDHSEITIYKINFDLYADTPSVGYVKQTNCKGNTNHFKSKESIGAISSLVNISHCDVKMIKGNSGSGYFNRANHLVGVHAWGFHVEDSDEDWAKRIRAQYPEIKQNAGGGVNLACIPALNGKPLLTEEMVNAYCQFDFHNYFQIAKAYADLREEEANINEWEEIAVQALDQNKARIPFVEFSEEPKREIHHFEIDFSGSQQGLRKTLFEKFIAVRFASLPKCIKGEPTEKFDLSILGPKGLSQIDTSTFYETQELELRDISVETEKLSSGLYNMSFQASDFGYTLRDALNWGLYDTIDLKLSGCP